MPEPHFLFSKTRELIEGFNRRGIKTFQAFNEFVSFVLHLTIARKNAIVKLYPSKDSRIAVIGGSPHPRSAIPLNNQYYLRFMFRLSLDSKDKLTVLESSFQYQREPEKSLRWIFRYDYTRSPVNDYPPSHLQINAKLREAAAVHRDCPNIHFPTNRISLEAVIRLLVEQFEIKCNEPKNWRKVLAASERAFIDSAFHPLSGPEH